MSEVDPSTEDIDDVVVGAWSELRLTGEIGYRTAALVYETVDAVRRLGHYPPPEGVDRWDAGVVQDVAHEFLGGKGAKERLARLVASADDERSFERLVHTAIRNMFRMEARTTNVGAIMRALEHAIDRDDEIVTVGSKSWTKAWSLRAYADQFHYSGDPGVLVDAAHAVPGVQRAAWNSERRRAPIAEPASLLRVIRAILTAAKAPVLRRLFVDVIVARFPLAWDPPNVEVDEIFTDASVSPEAAAIAQVIWADLKPNDRLVVAVLDLDVRDIAERTGLSKSTAHRAQVRAKKVLSEHLADLDDQIGVVAALALRSKTLQRRGTFAAGSASHGDEED